MGRTLFQPDQTQVGHSNLALHAPLNLRDWIAACVRRALQGQAPAALREYSFSFDELAKRITLKAEVERDLTEGERESLAVVETEVYSDLIFGNDTIVETEVSVVRDEMQLDPLQGIIVLLRDRGGP